MDERKNAKKNKKGKERYDKVKRVKMETLTDGMKEGKTINKKVKGKMKEGRD